MYIRSHGYNLTAIYHIEHALKLAGAPDQGHTFINYLNSHRMAWTEAEFLWKIIPDEVKEKDESYA
jgi:hypothetical protein